ncbi:MAG TPA: hypothetical protein VFI09_02320 [Solirubrobacterales bacterium]|nr:hypothetical protein [Solirubrobacterales bacterium]
MILPITAPMIFVSPFSGRLIARFGARRLMTAAMAAMPAEKVGVASGVLAMDRVMAGTIALAVVGAVFHALLGGDGFVDAVGGSTWVLVGLVAVGAVLTWTFVRDSGRSVPEPHARHRHFHL